jgi:3-methyl-2-oxobutanoate hydroxymethyltransferase
MLGLYKELAPRFLKRYADLAQVTVDALATFRREVESGAFPGPEHTYPIDEAELARLLQQLRV